MKAVIVTTEFRGVFYGRLKSEDTEKRIVELERFRNIIYWPRETQGFVGLSTEGPLKGCRLGALGSTIKLWAVTSVIECSETAIKRFEGAL